MILLGKFNATSFTGFYKVKSCLSGYLQNFNIFISFLLSNSKDEDFRRLLLACSKTKLL